MRRYNQRLYRTVRAVVKNEGDVEDVRLLVPRCNRVVIAVFARIERIAAASR